MYHYYVTDRKCRKIYIIPFKTECDFSLLSKPSPFVLLSSDTEYFLGQHETNLSFGRFRLEHTKRVKYSVPYALSEEGVEVEEEQEENPFINNSSKMAPKGLENKENLLYGKFFCCLCQFVFNNG